MQWAGEGFDKATSTAGLRGDWTYTDAVDVIDKNQRDVDVAFSVHEGSAEYSTIGK